MWTIILELFDCDVTGIWWMGEGGVGPLLLLWDHFLFPHQFVQSPLPPLTFRRRPPMLLSEWLRWAWRNWEEWCPAGARPQRSKTVILITIPSSDRSLPAQLSSWCYQITVIRWRKSISWLHEVTRVSISQIIGSIWRRRDQEEWMLVTTYLNHHSGGGALNLSCFPKMRPTAQQDQFRIGLESLEDDLLNLSRRPLAIFWETSLWWSNS